MRSMAATISILGVLTVASVRAEVEFAGYLKTDGQVHFLLADRAAETASDWLPLDGSFAGCTVAAFDPRTETLLVEKAGVFRQLRLRSARGVEMPASGVQSTLKALFPTTREPAPAPGNRLLPSMEGRRVPRKNVDAEKAGSPPAAP